MSGPRFILDKQVDHSKHDIRSIIKALMQLIMKLYFTLTKKQQNLTKQNTSMQTL